MQLAEAVVDACAATRADPSSPFKLLYPSEASIKVWRTRTTHWLLAIGHSLAIVHSLATHATRNTAVNPFHLRPGLIWLSTPPHSTSISPLDSMLCRVLLTFVYQYGSRTHPRKHAHKHTDSIQELPCTMHYWLCHDKIYCTAGSRGKSHNTRPL